MPNLLILTDLQSPALNTGEMKIPRLHPWGGSAEIFEKQISLICAMIGESHDYVFLDGSVSCGVQRVRRSQLPGSRPAVLGPRGYDRALIISARDTCEKLTALPLSFFTIGSPPNLPGSFYNWYEGLSSSQVRDAHDLVKGVIEADGPFDGVIGFSQGALLALSILYHHETCHLDRTPPFCFAIFFCAVLSITPHAMFKADIVAKYSKYYKQVKHYEESEKYKAKMVELERGAFLQDDNRAAVTHKLSRLKNHRAILLLPGQKAALVKDIFSLVRQLVDNSAEHNHAARMQWNTRGWMEGFPRVYHPLVNIQRISIFMVQIIGRSDPLRPHGELQARLCSKGLTRVVEFEGVHKVPHRMNDV